MTSIKEDLTDTSINTLVKYAHQTAKDSGFHDRKRELGTSLMLIISELSEILEADRKGILNEVNAKIPLITNFEEELADVVIRIMDLAGEYKLNLSLALKFKMSYNKTREKKHGKRY